MLGSIEELEKNIEEFQNNVAASGELCALLDSYVAQVKQQNDSFNTNSKALLQKISDIPDVVDQKNTESNQTVQTTVSKEVEKAIRGFAAEQEKYLTSLEETKKLLATAAAIPKIIQKENSDSNQAIREAVSERLGESVAQFTTEQGKYLTALEETRRQMEAVSAIPETIRKDNSENNDVIKADVAKSLNDALQIFAQAQQSYLSSLEETRTKIDSFSREMISRFEADQKIYFGELQKVQDSIKSYEVQMEQKYREFTQTLESMNVSNLYNQNLELKKTLDKRTTILMILTCVSVVVAIVGLFI